MAQLTIPDSKELGGSYNSPRYVNNVLIGEDAARLLIEASLSGDATALQSLLSQPQWIKTIRKTSHHLLYEERPRNDPNDVRNVMAMPISNLEQALTAAAGNDQAGILSMLLTFAAQRAIEASDVITTRTINRTLDGGYAAVFKALASADPDVINLPLLGHGTRPLYEAVRRRQPVVVTVLLELGADPRILLCRRRNSRTTTRLCCLSPHSLEIRA